MQTQTCSACRRITLSVGNEFPTLLQIWYAKSPKFSGDFLTGKSINRNTHVIVSQECACFQPGEVTEAPILCGARLGTGTCCSPGCWAECSEVGETENSELCVCGDAEASPRSGGSGLGDLCPGGALAGWQRRLCCQWVTVIPVTSPEACEEQAEVVSRWWASAGKGNTSLTTCLSSVSAAKYPPRALRQLHNGEQRPSQKYSRPRWSGLRH